MRRLQGIGLIALGAALAMAASALTPAAGATLQERASDIRGVAARVHHEVLPNGGIVSLITLDDGRHYAFRHGSGRIPGVGDHITVATQHDEAASGTWVLRTANPHKLRFESR